MAVNGKAVLVTGANRGIGQALVEEALRRGAWQVYAGTRRPLAHHDECFEKCSNAWGFYINTGLRNLIAKGQGAPNATEHSQTAILRPLR